MSSDDGRQIGMLSFAGFEDFAGYGVGGRNAGYTQDIGFVGFNIFVDIVLIRDYYSGPVSGSFAGCSDVESTLEDLISLAEAFEASSPGSRGNEQDFQCDSLSANLRERTASEANISTYSTMIWGGTMIFWGVKFQMALIPLCTMISATS